MSKYGLVEAEEITGGDDSSRGKLRRDKQGFRSRGPRGRPRGQRREYDDQSSYPGNIFIPDTPETREYLTTSAIAAIEAHFTVDYLCQDTYLRSYMDEAGFLPIAFICNFPHVACYGAEYQDIIDGLKACEQLEVDEENECVRLKENWELWLFPNPQGGRGLARYVKQADAYEETSNDAEDLDAQEVEPATTEG